MDFEVIGKISEIETIAVGTGIREVARLRRVYGGGKWRKVKGVAQVQLGDGRIRLAELHWYEAHGVGKRNVSGIWIKDVVEIRQDIRFAVCVDNTDYPSSLELHKIYRVLPDQDAEADGDLRIIDESGEDYLYSSEHFTILDLPLTVEKSLLQRT